MIETSSRRTRSGSTDETEKERGYTVSSRFTRVRRGCEGGALATLVMTVYRLPVTRSLPPTAEFWARYVSGDSPEDHPVVALLLHFVYGIAAGGLFSLVFSERESVPVASGDRGPPSRPGEVSLTLYGLLYGVVLSVVGDRLVLGVLLDLDPDDRFAFHVSHVLYGITLGAWVGTRTRNEE